MKARAHGLSGAVGWLGVAVTVKAVGHPLAPVADIGGTLVAAGWALWNDLDCQATAARALGWPSRALALVVARVSGGHREATHTLLATAVLSVLAAILAAVPYVSLVTVGLGLAWCQAALATADRGRVRLRTSSLTALAYSLPRLVLAVLLARRVGSVVRWVAAASGAWLVLTLDPTPYWVPFAVLVGGWAHLLGDMLTRDEFAVLAPFSAREFGGLGWIPPTPRGQRVTVQEWAAEALLVLLTIGAVVNLAGVQVVA